jgi:acyl-coenzyme A synthetase/AMP-(fatty) acid ligase
MEEALPLRKKSELKTALESILASPLYPKKEFSSQETFEELYAMAAHLRDYFGGKPARDRIVCLCAENKPVVASALLAALAGGFSLAFPCALSRSALTDLYRLTAYRYAITDGPRPLPSGVESVLPEKKGPSWISSCHAAADPDREWVYLFTGGSTGTPRIWRKTVRNLMAEAFHLKTEYSVTPDDRILSTVSPYHIYGLLYSILLPLAASASVSGETPSFPAEIEAAVHRNGATILVSVPAHYRALNGYPFKPASLRLAFSSAGMLPAEDAEAFSDRTGIGIVEIYGSTETGGIASRNRAAGEIDFTPFKNVDFRIENEAVLVRSDFLSPSLRFREDGYFQTEDRAAHTMQNRFKLLGRSDGIVKVGGKRVDLEAVRQTIERHPGVRNVLVIALAVGGGRDKQIAAVVEGKIDASELNLFLAGLLEPYARPRRIRVIEKIPAAPTGKYDRRSIEALFE